jgi:sugar phosphate isomerase/epimerase
VCAFAAEAGYAGLELAPFTLVPAIEDLPAARRRELRRIAEGHGLEIIGLHWLLARTAGFHLTSPDPAVRARTARYLVALAQACGDLGGRVMVFGWRSTCSRKRCRRSPRAASSCASSRWRPPRPTS